jgi:hypothetical protein
VKRLLSLLLLFSFLIMSMSKSLILVHYEINKKEITEKYCINKDKPEMHCCGKCLLKKKLAQQEEQQKYPAFPDVKTDIQLYCTSISGIANINSSQTVIIVSANKSIRSLLNGGSIFHPPCC